MTVSGIWANYLRDYNCIRRRLLLSLTVILKRVFSFLIVLYAGGSAPFNIFSQMNKGKRVHINNNHYYTRALVKGGEGIILKHENYGKQENIINCSLGIYSDNSIVRTTLLLLYRYPFSHASI